MEKIISGTDLANEIKLKLKDEVLELKEKYQRAPKLVVILVGDDPASQSYVRGKSKACELVGIENVTLTPSSEITEIELLDLVHELNNDETVDGILVQLPLPKHIDSDKVINSVSLEKDVDGFNEINVSKLWQGKSTIYPCTPNGIIRMLESRNYDIDGKNAVIVGRSQIVGLPISKLLLDRNATVTICHSHTKNLADITSKADILIAAVGKAKVLTKEYIKNGAFVIDVGVNRLPDTRKLVGDVDLEDCLDKVSYITKVPGGVGPMTISSLMENTVLLYKRHMEA